MCVALQRHARLRTCLGRWLCVALYAQAYTAPLISFWRLRLETRSCHKVAQRWLYLFTNGSKETRGISGLLAPWAPEGNFSLAEISKAAQFEERPIFRAAGGGSKQISSRRRRPGAIFQALGNVEFPRFPKYAWKSCKARTCRVATSNLSIKKSRFLGFCVVNLHRTVKTCIFFDRRTKLFKLKIQVSAIVRRE